MAGGSGNSEPPAGRGFGGKAASLAPPVVEVGGKTWDSSKEANGPTPQIQIQFRADKSQPAATHGYATGYELKLGVGEPRDGKLRGEISLKVPEPDDVSISGPFTLDLAKPRPPSEEQPPAN